MLTNKLLSVSFAVILFSITGFSQEAKPIDKFGDANCEDLMARLDGFAIAIQNETNSHFGYVVIYEGEHERYVYDRRSNGRLKTFSPVEGEANTYGEFIRNYLIKNRGISKNNLMIVSGGFREKFSVELWIVPRNGKIPEATPTKDTLKYRKGSTTDICDEM